MRRGEWHTGVGSRRFSWKRVSAAFQHAELSGDEALRVVSPTPRRPQAGAASRCHARLTIIWFRLRFFIGRQRVYHCHFPAHAARRRKGVYRLPTAHELKVLDDYLRQSDERRLEYFRRRHLGRASDTPLDKKSLFRFDSIGFSARGGDEASAPLYRLKLRRALSLAADAHILTAAAVSPPDSGSGRRRYAQDQPLHRPLGPGRATRCRDDGHTFSMAFAAAAMRLLLRSVAVALCFPHGGLLGSLQTCHFACRAHWRRIDKRQRLSLTERAASARRSCFFRLPGKSALARPLRFVGQGF